MWRPVGRKAEKAGFRRGTSRARTLSGHDLRRLFGLWVYALSFRRGVLSVLDVAFVATECFLPRRRCAVEGALLDELLVTTSLALLLDADLRAQPHLQLFATDASLSGAGASRLYDSSDEKGCSVRLVWNLIEFDAPTRTSRFASGDGQSGGGHAVG